MGGQTKYKKIVVQGKIKQNKFMHERRKKTLKKIMHWPKKIHTREMLTKETPPNTFLMVRFKCYFSMNIVTVIQFVLKVFFIFFSLSTVGTDH